MIIEGGFNLPAQRLFCSVHREKTVDSLQLCPIEEALQSSVQRPLPCKFKVRGYKALILSPPSVSRFWPVM